MAAGIEPLPYSTDHVAERTRLFHVAVLPALWLPAGAAATRFYGDEYGVFIITNYPAAISLHVAGLLEPLARLPREQWMWIVVVAGAALMATFGWGMDRLRLQRRTYFLLPFLLALVVVALHGGGFDPQRMPQSPWMRSEHYVGEVGSIATAWPCYLLAAGSILVAPARLVGRFRGEA